MRTRGNPTGVSGFWPEVQLDRSIDRKRPETPITASLVRGEATGIGLEPSSDDNRSLAPIQTSIVGRQSLSPKTHLQRTSSHEGGISVSILKDKLDSSKRQVLCNDVPIPPVLVMVQREMDSHSNFLRSTRQPSTCLHSALWAACLPRLRRRQGVFQGIRGLSSDGLFRGWAAVTVVPSARCPAIVLMSPTGISLGKLLPSRAYLRFSPQ